ncbi:MAG: hypothetical protein Q7V62_01405 [Actinomycetota bacterium]|nr:hypothetical protein [Actinomycetota bacterium]
MPDVHTHEIVLRGRLSSHLLGPFLDDFTVDLDTTDHAESGHDTAGCTRLVGIVRDSSHLHGLVAYLASINAELVSITPIHTHTIHSNTRSTS